MIWINLLLTWDAITLNWVGRNWAQSTDSNERDFRVFTSEERIYVPEKKCNHHLHFMRKPVEKQIFMEEESDSSLLYPLLCTGASAMREKLCQYAHWLLPGWKYWEPDPAIKAVLQQLKPNNDVCESILGLKDYLTTAIPNLHQLSRSNLIQVRKNKTIQWFQQFPKETAAFYSWTGNTKKGRSWKAI